MAKYPLTAVLCLLTFICSLSGGASRAEGPGLQDAYHAIEGKRNFEALRILSAYRPDDRELPLYYYLKGLAYKGIKKYRDAVDFLNRAYITAKDRRLRELALYHRGMAYLLDGFFYEAASNFRLFVRLFPRSGLLKDAYRNYAQASLKTGNYVESLTYFRKAEESPETVFGKAEVFHRLGLYKTAYEIYRKGLISYEEYMKKHPDVLYYYAENLRLMGKQDKAKSLFYLLMESHLRERAYLSLGLIEYSRGKYEPAAAYFRRAVQAPDRVVKRKALLYLGRIHMKNGDVKAGKRMFLQIRKDFPYTPEADEALIHLSKAERKAGNFLASEGYLKEILFGRKPTAEALNELEALVRDIIEQGDPSFRKIWKDCGNWLMSPDREKILLLAADRMFREGGDFIRTYRYLLSSGSTTAKIQAMYRLAKFYGRLGDYGQVKSLLERLRKNGAAGDMLRRIEAVEAVLRADGNGAIQALKKIERPEKDDLRLLWKASRTVVDPFRVVSLYKKMVVKAGSVPEYEKIGDYLFSTGRSKEGYKYYLLAIKQTGGKEGRILLKAALSGGDREMIRLAAASGTKPYSSLARGLLEEMNLKEEIGAIL